MEHLPALDDNQSCTEHGALEASNLAKGDKATMEPKDKLPVVLHCHLSFCMRQSRAYEHMHLRQMCFEKMCHVGQSIPSAL